MQNLGIVKPGSKLILNWDTFDGGTGAPITMTDFVAGDIEVYKDVDFVTQRASDAGYALLDDGIDVDAITGVHAISIDLADNSTAGFWACGSHYSVRIGPVTIDAQTVNFWLAEFTIGQPDAFLNTTIASLTDQDTLVITDGPAEADALIGCVVLIQDVASKVQLGFAVVTDYIVTSKTVQLLAGPSFTFEATDNISFFPPANTHWFGQAAQGGDGVNLTETGGDGAQLTEAGGDGDHLVESGGTGDQFTGIASVGAVAGDVGGDVKGGVDGSVGSNVELGPSEVQTEVDSAIATARLDELLAADSDIDGASPPTVGSVFHELLSKTAGSFTFDQLTDSLEALRDRGDAAWTTGAGGSPFTLASGTIGATGNDTTHLHLTGLTQGDDELNDFLIVITDVSTSEIHSRWIDDWTLVGELALVATLPFTPEASTDTYTVLGIRKDVNVGEIEGADPTDTIRDAVVDDATRIDASALNTASGAIGSDGTGLTEAGGTGDQFTGIASVGAVAGAVASVTAEVTADVTKISGDAGAADNLEAQYDGDGLAGDTFPATQSQIAGIANVGSAVNITPDSYTLTTGTQSSGTVASVAALDGVNHEHTDTGPGSMDLYYEFIIGSGIPTSVTVTGYLNNNNDDLEVYGFDWVASAWVRIGTLAGKNSSTNEVDSYEMFVGMVGFGANEGIVRVRFTDGAFTLTTATLAIDQIFLSFSRGSEGYEGGAIWIDTTLSNTNTVVGIDGTARNPVSTIAAANTLSVSTNLNRFHIAPGSAITFAAAQQSQVFIGESWTLALGGRDIADTTIVGATVTGIAVGSGTQNFIDCSIGAVTIPDDTHFEGCGISGTQTLPAGDVFYDRCHSAIAGSGAPQFDFGGAVATTDLHVRNYSGGLDIRNHGAAATDTTSIEGRGQVILNANCVGGTMEIRGNFSLADSSSTVTITDDARYNTSQDVATVGGSVMRGTDSAALASVLGALDDAAAAGDPTTNDTLMKYLKQVINVLMGSTGITTFPAEAGAGDGVSMAEVLRAIEADVTGLAGSAMRGTDSAALASVATEVRLAELNAGNLPTDVAANATAIAALNDVSAADILTTALTEAYAADGAAGTLTQILYAIQAFLQERSVSGTTVTVKKVDGAATAMTFTLNDQTTPTSITRAT